MFCGQRFRNFNRVSLAFSVALAIFFMDLEALVEGVATILALVDLVLSDVGGEDASVHDQMLLADACHLPPEAVFKVRILLDTWPPHLILYSY